MLTLLMVAMALMAPAADAEGVLNVGSKRFTESYILGEIIKQTAERAGEASAVHKQGLGNTAIVLNALTTGGIDVYAEYTGTIAKEILKLDQVPSLQELNTRLAAMGLAAGVPLGFNNTYAIALRGDDARAKRIATLSDLKSHPELKLGLSQEFIGRADGWPGLKQAYELPFATPRGLDHGLAYEAIQQGQVDAIDIYSTDAKIDRYGLVVLADDRHYFPPYDAVLLYRSDLPTRLPKTWAALQTLAGRIDETRMRRMNAQAELANQDFATIAREFIATLGTTSTTASGSGAASGAAALPQDKASTPGAGTDEGTPGAKPTSGAPGSSLDGFWNKLFGPDFLRLTGEHLLLVLVSLAISVAVGVPLGVLAARQPRTEAVILGLSGIVQTIPSLALLAVLIPLTGHIGIMPALIALSLYSLLPIVRNTHAGLTQTARGMRLAALSLGMRSPDILRSIELPLAAPTILAGVKTSAVINVGTATIAAFIGAGGYGERIVTGLALNDHAMLLAGAIPAAALALLMEGGFRLAERWVIAEGLRVAPR